MAYIILFQFVHSIIHRCIPFYNVSSTLFVAFIMFLRLLLLLMLYLHLLSWKVLLGFYRFICIRECCLFGPVIILYVIVQTFVLLCTVYILLYFLFMILVSLHLHFLLIFDILYLFLCFCLWCQWDCCTFSRIISGMLRFRVVQLNDLSCLI